VIPIPKPRPACYKYAYELRPVNLGLIPKCDAEAEHAVYDARRAL